MDKYETAVAVFPNHEAAEKAVKSLTAAGFEMKNLSVVGKGYHSEEKVVGFYNTGDRIKFWGSRGAFWGGFWGLFFGGLFMTIPVVGHVVVLGYLAAIVASGIENAIVVGGLSALGAALYSFGHTQEQRASIRDRSEGRQLPRHGARPDRRSRTRAEALATLNPSSSDIHRSGQPEAASEGLVHEHA